MYHVPVMLQPCLEGLNIQPNGTYVDVTFGGGGHSKAILEQLGEKGRLFAFDQDPDAVQNVPNDKRFTLIQQNFRYLDRFLTAYGASKVDGILADLGISSHQIDVPERGFSHRYDATLDMRMNTSVGKTAADILNTYEESALADVLWQYGELNNSRKLASGIILARSFKPIATTTDLKNALAFAEPRVGQSQYWGKIFQALRIEVNNELDVLKDFLQQSTKCLAQNGRLVVMSYHSLEDRLVKNFINSGNFKGELEKDLYGNVKKPLNAITRKVVVADEDEINRNNRARSAKLRIAEMI